MQEKNTNLKQTAKVVLGGGAALGLAEIGVLEVLEKRFDIVSVIGTSMGAIVGGLYAKGLSPSEILALANLLKQKKRWFSTLRLDTTLSGIFDGNGLLKWFDEWTALSSVEECRIPFWAVSYDLNQKRSVIINKGPLAHAMRASSSIPYIFTPYICGKYAFVDGGVEYPLPLGPASSLPGEITIAVNVLPAIFNEPELIDLNKASATSKQIRLNEVFLNTVLQNQAFIAMHSIVDNKPDIIVEAWYPKGSVFGFSEADTFFEWGKQQAEEALAGFEQPHHFERLLRHYRKLSTKLASGLPKYVTNRLP